MAPRSLAAVETAPGAVDALALASRPPTPPIVCVAGSLFLVGEVLAHLAGDRDKPCPIENDAASMGSLFP
jgi:hypothetical protein